MNNTQKITLNDEIAEIKRELSVRQKVYPQWIRQGKISEDLAKQRIAVLQSLLSRLSSLSGTQTSLFQTGPGAAYTQHNH